MACTPEDNHRLSDPLFRLRYLWGRRTAGAAVGEPVLLCGVYHAEFYVHPTKKILTK